MTSPMATGTSPTITSVIAAASCTHVTYDPTEVVRSTEDCYGQTRWRGGKLEQLWSLSKWGTLGQLVRVDEEWRVVPTVD